MYCSIKVCSIKVVYFLVYSPGVSTTQDLVYIGAGSAVGFVLITILLLSIVAVTVYIVKIQNQDKPQAKSYHTAIPLYAEIPEPLYEPIHAYAETECTTEALGGQREDGTCTPDQTVVVVTRHEDDLYNQAHDGDIANIQDDRSLADHHFEQVKIFDLSHLASSATHLGHYGSSVDPAAGQMEGAQIIEEVQAQALNVNAGVYYERAPNVNTAQILSDAGVYERAQVYERVPNVNILQILLQVTNSDDYFHGKCANSEQLSMYERVQYSDKTLQLIRGVMRPYEQISGYERVHYSETMEQIWRTIFGEESMEPYEKKSGYQRVQYSEAAMRLLRRMPHVATCTDADQNSGYESVQYEE